MGCEIEAKTERGSASFLWLTALSSQEHQGFSTKTFTRQHESQQTVE